MNKVNPAKINLLFTLLLVTAAWGAPAGYAQEQITILNADRAEGGTIDGEPVRKLIGNIQLSTDGMTMNADSVYQFETRDMIRAFNIQIESEQDIVWADTLFHNTQTGFSEFRGRVIILSEQNILFSESVDYDRVLDSALFNSRVRFEDDRGVLLADDGYYFQNTDIAFFRGNVQLSDSTQYLEADSLYMNRETDFYRLYDRVYAEDFEEDITLAGDYLEADSAGYRLLSGNAWMMQVNESGTDTSHITSQIIEATETDTADYINAYRDVSIWSGAFSAVADTALYRSDLEQFRLISSPVAWQERIQLTGPYIEALLEDDEIRFLTSYVLPVAVQEDSLTGRLNQMKGDTLHAYFENGEIDSIVVFDNSELIFHLKDEEEEPDGLIDLIAAGPSTIRFLNGELAQFKASRNIEGSHLPEDPKNIDRRLSGFRWDPELRPVQPEIQQARLPDIPGERFFELPERYIRYQNENEESPFP
ncbi:MAG: OstA-like protein [Balneolaceae bacterium]